MEYYLYVIIKLLVGFVVVILYMNISGKTQFSQMTSIDLIGNFILGSIIGGIIYNKEISFYQYFCILLLGIGLIYLLNLITRKINIFRKIAIGDPIPIIKNGEFLIETFKNKKNPIDILNVASLLRSQGIASFDKIYYAQIEPNGQITVICDKEKLPSLILIKDGNFSPYGLKEIKKDKEWLLKIINSSGIKNIQDIFFAEYKNKKLRCVLSNGKIKEIKIQ